MLSMSTFELENEAEFTVHWRILKSLSKQLARWKRTKALGLSVVDTETKSLLWFPWEEEKDCTDSVLKVILFFIGSADRVLAYPAQSPDLHLWHLLKPVVWWVR